MSLCKRARLARKPDGVAEPHPAQLLRHMMLASCCDRLEFRGTRARARKIQVRRKLMRTRHKLATGVNVTEQPLVKPLRAAVYYSYACSQDRRQC